MTNYQMLKILHLLSAAVLLGAGAAIAFFTWFGYRFALRDRSIQSLRNILRLTVRADWVFTAVAVVLQPLTGAWMMLKAGWSFDSAWFAWVVILFVAVGTCWLPVVWIQIRLRDMAMQCDDISALPASFHHYFRIWLVLGVPAFSMVLALYWLMVSKPGL
jgi:uncharacterized membrane protein